MPHAIKEEKLDHITKMVYALYAKHGFDGISMDEVSRQINISKTTLYHYFTSKEDIVRGMVDTMISRLDSVSFAEIKSINDVMTAVREFYVKSILVTSVSGSRFLEDLKNKFPDCYDQYRQARRSMLQKFSVFYEEAVKKGYFKDLSFTLVCHQFAYMLSLIVNMDYLEENSMKLTDGLKEYCRMFLCQILTQDYLYVADQNETYDFVEELTATLLNDYFIDSIRR